MRCAFSDEFKTRSRFDTVPLDGTGEISRVYYEVPAGNVSGGEAFRLLSATAVGKNGGSVTGTQFDLIVTQLR